MGFHCTCTVVGFAAGTVVAVVAVVGVVVVVTAENGEKLGSEEGQGVGRAQSPSGLASLMQIVQRVHLDLQ